MTKAAIAAKTDDEDRTITQLRYDIAMDLGVEGIKQHADPAWTGWAVPKRKGVDRVVAVTIPAPAWLGRTAEQATIEGVGPIDLETALRLAANAPSVLRLLTDPVTGVRSTMDRKVYSPPADLRRWVQYRDQRCRFPGCNRAASDCDLDHATEWQHFGLTNDDNLVCLCRGDHLTKSLRLAQEELRADGRVEWESPWGRRSTDPPPDTADPAPIDMLPCRNRVSVDPDEPVRRRPAWMPTGPRNTDPDEPAPF